MTQKDEPVIDMGDMGLVQVQCEFQSVFQKFTALILDSFSFSLATLNDNNEVIGISTIGEWGHGSSSKRRSPRQKKGRR